MAITDPNLLLDSRGPEKRQGAPSHTNTQLHIRTGRSLPVRQHGRVVAVHGGVHQILHALLVDLSRRSLRAVHTVERVGVSAPLDNVGAGRLRHGIGVDHVPGVKGVAVGVDVVLLMVPVLPAVQPFDGLADRARDAARSIGSRQAGFANAAAGAGCGGCRRFVVVAVVFAVEKGRTRSLPLDSQGPQSHAHFNVLGALLRLLVAAAGGADVRCRASNRSRGWHNVAATVCKRGDISASEEIGWLVPKQRFLLWLPSSERNGESSTYTALIFKASTQRSRAPRL